MKTIAAVFKEYEELPDFYGMQLDSVNLKGHSGDSLLHVAVYRKDLEEVKALIAAGAEPNVRGENGHTPLLAAVSVGSTEIVKLLLLAGAKKDSSNDDGVTPHQLAKSAEILALLEGWPM